MAAARDALPAWASCAAGSDPSAVYSDCIAPAGSTQFKKDWTFALEECASGRDPANLEKLISSAAEGAGRRASLVDCERVFEVAASESILSTEEIRQARDLRVAALAVEQEKTEAAAEERAALGAEWQANFPDTFGKIVTLPPFADTATGLEIGRGVGGIPGAIWTAGFAGYLLSDCAADINIAERAVLAGFVTEMLIKSRGDLNTGVDFDEAFKEAATGASMFGEGAFAAKWLQCAEPVSTKLLENLLRILSGS